MLGEVRATCSTACSTACVCVLSGLYAAGYSIVWRAVRSLLRNVITADALFAFDAAVMTTIWGRVGCYLFHSWSSRGWVCVERAAP